MGYPLRTIWTYVSSFIVWAIPAGDLTTIDIKQIAAAFELMIIRCITIRGDGLFARRRFSEHPNRGWESSR